MIERLWRRVRQLLRRGNFERDLTEEMEFHRAMLLRETEAGRLDEASAREQVSRQMGNTVRARESSRETWMFGWVEALMHDARHALRLLSKTPVFTLCAVLTLALGIGANAAIFTLIDALLLRALPVRDAGRLVQITVHSDVFTVHSDDLLMALSYPLFADLKTRTRTMSGMFTWNSTSLSTGWGADATNVNGAVASGDIYATLTIRAQVGRLFTAEDDQTGKPPVVVLSDSYWDRAYSRDPGVVGRTILLNRVAFTIVGVTPRSFFGLQPGSSPAMTIPIHASAALHPRFKMLESKNGWYLSVLARLNPGVSAEQARAELRAISPLVMRGQEDAMLSPDRLQAFRAQKLDLIPGAGGSSWLALRYRKALLVLMAISGVVLAIACVNLASLLLSRAAARQKELSMRLALGAGRLRLIKQLLTESAILSAFGAALGMLFAFWATRALVAFLSTEDSPLVLNLNPDWRVAGFLALLSVAAALLSGAAPALQGTNLDPQGAFKFAGAGMVNGGRFRLGKALIAVQVALSVLLMTGAMLFVRTLGNLRSQGTGFEASNLLFIDLTAHEAGMDEKQVVSYRSALLDRVRDLPFVQSASATAILPLDGGYAFEDLAPAFRPGLNAAERKLYIHRVAPNYFRTMGERLLRGRDFTEADAESKEKPTILSASAAQTYFPGESALGESLEISGTRYRIIGVVEDAKYADLREHAPRTAYLRINGLLGNIVMRTRVDKAVAMDAVRGLLRKAGKDVAIGQTVSLTEQIDRALLTERLIAMLASVFAALAAVLVAIGLYGVVAYTAARRTSEIGVRLAVGATRGSILWMMLRDALWMSGIGVMAGVPLTAWGARVVGTMLYGIQPTDPLTIGVTIAFLLAVAGAAAFVPARKASQLDPMRALRYE